MKFVNNDGGRSKYFPSKLKKDQAGDCVFRAIATALDKDYKEVWTDLFDLGYAIGQLPNCAKTYEKYLKDHGFIKQKTMKNRRGRKYKVNKAPWKKDVIYVVHTTSHLTCVKGGDLHDTWNCGEWCANSFYTK